MFRSLYRECFVLVIACLYAGACSAPPTGEAGTAFEKQHLAREVKTYAGGAFAIGSEGAVAGPEGWEDGVIEEVFAEGAKHPPDDEGMANFQFQWYVKAPLLETWTHIDALEQRNRSAAVFIRQRLSLAAGRALNNWVAAVDREAQKLTEEDTPAGQSPAPLRRHSLVIRFAQSPQGRVESQEHVDTTQLTATTAFALVKDASSRDGWRHLHAEEAAQAGITGTELSALRSPTDWPDDSVRLMDLYGYEGEEDPLGARYAAPGLEAPLPFIVPVGSLALFSGTRRYLYTERAVPYVSHRASALAPQHARASTHQCQSESQKAPGTPTYGRLLFLLYYNRDGDNIVPVQGAAQQLAMGELP